MKKSWVWTCLVVALSANAVGCKGLLQVNGKPIGGGGSSSSGSSSSDSSSSSNDRGQSAGGSNAKQETAKVSATPPPEGKPADWCEDAGYPPSRGDDYSLEKFKDVSVKENADAMEHRYTAAQFAGVFCTRDSVKDRDKILALHAQWMKNNNLDSTDFVVLAGLRQNRTWGSEKFEEIPGVVNQIENGGYSNGVFLEADRVGAKLSAYSRYRLVDRCEHGSNEKGLLHDILCTREKLDMRQAFADIDTLKEINIETRYHLRQQVRETQRWFTKKKAEIDAKAKEDPGIAQLVAIADATFKEWESPSPARQKLLALNEKMEVATRVNKNSAFAGCEKETKAAWEEHLKSVTLPKMQMENVLQTFVEATLDAPEGYLAYNALRMCSEGKQETPTRGFDFIGSDVRRRGPRTATIANWLAKAAQIKFDDRSLKMGQLFGGLGKDEGSRWERPRSGVIGTIKNDGGTATIAFKQSAEMIEDCVESVETGRIAGFDSAGGIMYRHKCVKWGKVKMDTTEEPIMIGAVLAEGLKPGMYFVGRNGLGIAATASAKSSKPLWVLGGSAN